MWNLLRETNLFWKVDSDSSLISPQSTILRDLNPANIKEFFPLTHNLTQSKLYQEPVYPAPITTEVNSWEALNSWCQPGQQQMPAQIPTPVMQVHATVPSHTQKTPTSQQHPTSLQQDSVPTTGGSSSLGTASATRYGAQKDLQSSGDRSEAETRGRGNRYIFSDDHAPGHIRKLEYDEKEDSKGWREEGTSTGEAAAVPTWRMDSLQFKKEKSGRFPRGGWIRCNLGILQFKKEKSGRSCSSRRRNPVGFERTEREIQTQREKIDSESRLIQSCSRISRESYLSHCTKISPQSPPLPAWTSRVPTARSLV